MPTTTTTTAKIRAHKRHRCIRLGIAAALATTAIVVGSSGETSAGLPTAAVAMGDSFISGEGAGNYRNVTNYLGISQGFTGWNANNKSAYFCHRSANASIEVAQLPGIDARFNLACSGGQPSDMVSPSYNRPAGRWVDSQIAQLQQVAATHDIDVVLIGLGSNNSHFTFGELAAKCTEGFLIDAWVGWWEVWAGPWNQNQEPCTTGDFPSRATLDAARADTIDAIRQIVLALDAIDADGEHRIVLQDYTDPLPSEIDIKWHKEAGRSDTRDKFRALGRERYQGGCPVHRASLVPAAVFTERLGNMVSQTRDAIQAQFPTVNIAYLNVQRAFDGARLCERVGSPANALATPVRFQKTPNGNFEQTMSGWNKLDLQQAATTCTSFYQTCQESFHPNAAGHAVLGQCLSVAAISPASTINCRRNPTTGSVTAQEIFPSVGFDTFGSSIMRRGGSVDVFVSYSLTTVGTTQPLSNVVVSATVSGTTPITLTPMTNVSGRFRFSVPCSVGPPPRVDMTASANLGATAYQFTDQYVIDMSSCLSSGVVGPAVRPEDILDMQPDGP